MKFYLSDISPNLPAGIDDCSIEIFAKHYELWALYQGNKILFNHLPEDVKDIFRQKMIENKSAMECLAKMNLVEDAMLTQFAWCNFGGFNRVADFDDGKLNHEYWDCGLRGKCMFEGKLCCAKMVNGEMISKREIEVIRMIADAMTDQEIATKLFISLHTMKRHRENIERKLGVKNKLGIVVWAIKNGITND